MNLEIITEKAGPKCLLRVIGDVDMNTSPNMRAVMQDIFRGDAEGGIKTLLIDLSRVQYMDSSGIATLVEIMQNCRKKSVRLGLCALSPPVRDVFELARLGSVFELYQTVDEAMGDSGSSMKAAP